MVDATRGSRLSPREDGNGRTLICVCPGHRPVLDPVGQALELLAFHMGQTQASNTPGGAGSRARDPHGNDTARPWSFIRFVFFELYVLVFCWLLFLCIAETCLFYFFSCLTVPFADDELSRTKHPPAGFHRARQPPTELSKQDLVWLGCSERVLFQLDCWEQDIFRLGCSVQDFFCLGCSEQDFFWLDCSEKDIRISVLFRARQLLQIPYTTYIFTMTKQQLLQIP